MTSSIQHAPAQPPFIPPWIKTRLDELGITEEMFEDLLKIYESVRDEYIDLTKKVKLDFEKDLYFKYVHDYWNYGYFISCTTVCVPLQAIVFTYFAQFSLRLIIKSGYENSSVKSEVYNQERFRTKSGS